MVCWGRKNWDWSPNPRLHQNAEQSQSVQRSMVIRDFITTWSERNHDDHDGVWMFEKCVIQCKINWQNSSRCFCFDWWVFRQKDCCGKARFEILKINRNELYFYIQSTDNPYVNVITFYTGWWFGTFFIFPYIRNNHPNWLLFFRGVAQPPTSIGWNQDSHWCLYLKSLSRGPQRSPTVPSWAADACALTWSAAEGYREAVPRHRTSGVVKEGFGEGMVTDSV